jgi:hypothetical protein
VEHLCSAFATETVLEVEGIEVYRAGKNKLRRIRKMNGNLGRGRRHNIHIVLVGVSVSDALD